MRSLVVGVVACVAAAVVRADAPVIKAAPLEIQVRSAETAPSFPVYTGSGTAIRAADGEMAGVIVARDLDGKTSNYLRAALTADSGRTLVKVGVNVVNGGKAPLAFRIGDLSVAAPGAVLMALGEGDHPFTKDDAVLGKVKGVTREIPAGEKLKLVYVYSLKTESAPGKLVYKGKQGIELKGVAQPAG
ncbi:MAG: hypothetical protein ACREKH_10930 [Candidatus Rokuibacteriota bacterium]